MVNIISVAQELGYLQVPDKTLIEMCIRDRVSGVLKGIGAKQEFLDATLRFSLSEFTTLEEIDYTLDLSLIHI